MQPVTVTFFLFLERIPILPTRVPVIEWPSQSSVMLSALITSPSDGQTKSTVKSVSEVMDSPQETGGTPPLEVGRATGISHRLREKRERATRTQASTFKDYDSLCKELNKNGGGGPSVWVWISSSHSHFHSTSRIYVSGVGQTLQCLLCCSNDGRPRVNKT